MFHRMLNRWKMRNHCTCGSVANQIDDTTFDCSSGCGVYDGSAEFEQQKLMIKEKDTMMRDL